MVERQPTISVPADTLQEGADSVLRKINTRIELADECLLVLRCKTLCRYFRLDDPKGGNGHDSIGILGCVNAKQFHKEIYGNRSDKGTGTVGQHIRLSFGGGNTERNVHTIYDVAETFPFLGCGLPPETYVTLMRSRTG